MMDFEDLMERKIKELLQNGYSEDDIIGAFDLALQSALSEMEDDE